MAPCGRPDFAAGSGFYARRLPDADRSHGREMIFARDPCAAGDNPVPGPAGAISAPRRSAAASDPRHDDQTDQAEHDRSPRRPHFAHRRRARRRHGAAAPARASDPLLSGPGHARRGPGRGHPQPDPQHPERGGRPAAGRRRALLDPRPGRCARLRTAPRRRARAGGGYARDRHARLFREAAHDGRLERADQRSLARRELPHQRGPADRAAAADRHRPAGRALGQRVARHDLAAVHRRPDRLGRDRRADDRKPGASRACLGLLGADRLQERHRRQREDRLRRDPDRLAARTISSACTRAARSP